MGNINRTHGFRGPHAPTPRTSQLAAREGFGPERPSPGAEGSSRPTGRRSRGRPRTTRNREEGMGRSDPAGTAPVGTMGEPGHLRTRSVPAQVRGNELAATRPFGPGPHQEDPPSRRSERTRSRQFVATYLGDRKSTHLNSSHGYISYAVFCL